MSPRFLPLGERENYRDSTGKVKHRNTRYLGIEVTINGEKTEKLNSCNLGAVMKTDSKIGPEGIVDVCI